MGSKARSMNVEPVFRPLEELRHFTGNFKDKIGKGSYGTVYKGRDDNGNDIAVKVLKKREGSIQEEEFKREFGNLLTLSHQNIIQLVGYCYESDKKFDDAIKKTIPIIRTFLCFDYAPEGNLDKHLSARGDKLDWRTCYKIIKGSCEGLCYLHNHPSGSAVWHLDLKPQNILLHHDMIPKIADFGLSKLISDQTSKETVNLFGTVKYTPPEYRDKKIISKEFDIYSLGVIILEIVAGTKTYQETSIFSHKDADLAFEKWKPSLSSMDYEQVRTCLRIALKCVDDERFKRPSIQDIIVDLNKAENMTSKVYVSLGLKSNMQSPENSMSRGLDNSERRYAVHTSRVLKQDKDLPRQTETIKKDYGHISRVVNQDKDARRQAEKQLHGSSSHSRHSGDKVILYVTTMSGIAKTFKECNTIRAALVAHQIDFTEKDLFDKPENQSELRRLLAGSPYKLPVPVLSINGRPVGDARKLLSLHSEERLQTLFE